MKYKSLLRILPVFFVIFSSLTFFTSCSEQPAENSVQMLTFASGDHVYISQWPDGTPQKIAKGKEPSLSYNGNYLAYSSKVGDKRRIRITDLNRNSEWFIEDVHGAGFRPQWSPVEDKLLFSSLVLTGNVPHRVVVVYEPLTRRKSAIVIRRTDIYSPVWSPDGKTVLAHDKENLYQWDLRGNLKHSFPLKGVFGDYHFTETSTFKPSQDRKLWLFEAKADADEQTNGVYLFDTNTHTARRITSEDIITNSFCWGPDETSVLVAGNRKGGEGNNYLMEFSLDGEDLGSWTADTVTSSGISSVFVSSIK